MTIELRSQSLQMFFSKSFHDFLKKKQVSKSLDIVTSPTIVFRRYNIFSKKYLMYTKFFLQKKILWRHFSFLSFFSFNDSKWEVCVQCQQSIAVTHEKKKSVTLHDTPVLSKFDYRWLPYKGKANDTAGVTYKLTK